MPVNVWCFLSSKVPSGWLIAVPPSQHSSKFSRTRYSKLYHSCSDANCFDSVVAFFSSWTSLAKCATWLEDANERWVLVVRGSWGVFFDLLPMFGDVVAENSHDRVFPAVHEWISIFVQSALSIRISVLLRINSICSNGLHICELSTRVAES